MKSSNIDELCISQLCYAHLIKDASGQDVFVNVYPHKIALEMFEGSEVVTVEVRRAEDGEQTEYWAWMKSFSKKPYVFIWPSEDKVKSCVPGFEKRTRDQEGKIVKVIVEKWSKL